MKGKKDLSKLVKKIITDKNGITRAVWVKTDKDAKDKPKKKKEVEGKTTKNKKTSDVKPYRSTPTEDLIALAKDNGLSWKENSDPRINRMRVIMALKAENILPETLVKKPKADKKPKAKKSEDKKAKYSSVEDLARDIRTKNNMESLIDEGYREYQKWDTGKDPDDDYDDDDYDDDDYDDDDYTPPSEIQEEADMIRSRGIIEAINYSIKDLDLEGDDIDYDDPEHGEQVIKDLKSDNPEKVLEALKYIKSTISENSMEISFGSQLMASVIHKMKLPEIS